MYGLYTFLLLQVLAWPGKNVLGIINGKNVPENSMPYMASVRKGGEHVCGGFLISEDFVVTAARCDVFLSDVNTASVVLGTNHLNIVAKTEKFIAKKCKHPSYTHFTKGNDIMLLKLAGNNEPTVTVKQIPLPTSEFNINEKSLPTSEFNINEKSLPTSEFNINENSLPTDRHMIVKCNKVVQSFASYFGTSEFNINENVECRVAGWGRTKTAAADVVNDLMMVGVSIIDSQDCKRMMPHLPANVICGAGGSGLCQGDFGGPLVCNGKAVGVASYIKLGDCENPNAPKVYTDIFKFLPWINGILQKQDC